MDRENEARWLAAAITTQDREAFGRLVQLHQARLRLVLRRFTQGNAALADELAQETFVRAFHAITKFRGESKFFSWLCQIGYNAYVDAVRKQQPTPVADLDEAPDEAGSAAGLDLKQDVDRALRKLSEPERVAITLCFRNDLTHEEAAGVMGVPLGTLKSHVSRAKEKLSQALGAWRKGD